jgi:hypothetical protein
MITKLGIDLPNNGPMTLTGDFLAKNIIWLGATTDSMGSGTTNDLGETRPAVMTATPTWISETEFHHKQITSAYPKIADVEQDSEISLTYEFAFPGMEGLFTGGSGLDLGTYRVDNFQSSGRMTMLFEDESHWETFKAGTYFKLETILRGDLIQGSYYNQLDIVHYSCKVNTNDVINRVGNLEYDFGWTARKDPTQGKSCQVTLINSTSDYDAPT